MAKVVGVVLNEQLNIIGLELENLPAHMQELGNPNGTKMLSLDQIRNLRIPVSNAQVVKPRNEPCRVILTGNKEFRDMNTYVMRANNNIEKISGDAHITKIVYNGVEDNEHLLGYHIQVDGIGDFEIRKNNILQMSKLLRLDYDVANKDGTIYIRGKNNSGKVKDDIPVLIRNQNVDKVSMGNKKSDFDIYALFDMIKTNHGLIGFGMPEIWADDVTVDTSAWCKPAFDINEKSVNLNVVPRFHGHIDLNGKSYDVTAFKTITLYKRGTPEKIKMYIAIPGDVTELMNILSGYGSVTNVTNRLAGRNNNFVASIINGIYKAGISADSLQYIEIVENSIPMMSMTTANNCLIRNNDELRNLIEQLYAYKFVTKYLGNPNKDSKISEICALASLPVGKEKKYTPSELKNILESGQQVDAAALCEQFKNTDVATLAELVNKGVNITTGVFQKPSDDKSTKTSVQVYYGIGMDVPSNYAAINKAIDNTKKPLPAAVVHLLEDVNNKITSLDSTLGPSADNQFMAKTVVAVLMNIEDEYNKQINIILNKLTKHKLVMLRQGNFAHVHTFNIKNWTPEKTLKRNGVTTVYDCNNITQDDPARVKYLKLYCSGVSV